MDAPLIAEACDIYEFTATDINSLCRICCKSENDNIEIFGNDADYDLATKIMTYLPIKVSPDDIFPHRACSECVGLVLKWDKLYQSCLETENKFQEILLDGKLNENIVYEVKSPYLENIEENDEEGSCFVEDSIANDTEYVSASMEVSSIMKDDFQENSQKEFSDSSEECTREYEEEDPAVKNRIFKSRIIENCPFCKVKARGRDNLNEHLKQNHSEEIFHCEICNNLKPRHELISHMISHTADSLNKKSSHEESKSKLKNDLTCTDCNKTFNNSSSVSYHKKTIHAKVKKHKCDICEKVFTCGRILMNHKLSIHAKKRSFKCEICSKMFKTDSNLYAHKKIHAEVYPYKCENCNKSFKFKHHLDAHSVQHTTQRNFSCVTCHKKFYLKNNLSKHMKTHCTSLDFGCHICGVKMKQRRYLQEHMKRVHQTTLSGTSK